MQYGLFATRSKLEDADKSTRRKNEKKIIPTVIKHAYLKNATMISLIPMWEVF